MNNMSDQKKICIVSAQYYPHVGGVEQYVDNLARELVALGHKVTIISSKADNSEEREKEENLEIIRMPSYQFMAGRFPFLKHNKRMKELDREIKKMSFDIMLVNTRFYTLSLYAVRLAKKMGIRCILLDHGTSHLNTGGKITSLMGQVYEHGITWLDKLYCKEFAGVSRAVLEWIKHFHIKSDLVLYNSINPESFRMLKDESKRAFRREFNIPEDELVIAFVGRLTVEKGIEELTEAVKKVHETRQDIHLLIAGDGYLKERIEEISDERIHLLGSLSKCDISKMLSETDIFCLPSVSEGFPTTVLEAAVSKNYIVSTYRGGTRELVSGREYGTILPDNNTEGLYKAIMQLADEREYMREAAERCCKEVEEKYTWEYVAKKFVSVI